MTLFEPSISIGQFCIFQNNHKAFECSFHAGVNVIRGRNSSGKTTIMDMLAYSLGAEAIRWKPEALKCTSTLVELKINGKAICLRREIDSTPQRPIAIFWGVFEEALKAGPQSWELYPFKRSANKISFSQALFNAMDIPSAQGEGASNLTIHQVLRVLYADQPSVHSPIFRLDPFDKVLTREMVGNYLCGIYDGSLYAAQLRIREVESSLSKKDSELKSIFHVLGRSGQTADVEHLGSEIKGLEQKRDDRQHALMELKETRKLPKGSKKSLKIDPNEIRNVLVTLRAKVLDTKGQIEALRLDMLDSIAFVDELQARLVCLEQSQETRSLFGNLNFKFCPSCLEPIIRSESANHACGLCKAPLDTSQEGGQLLRMKNELTIQIKESSSLIDDRTQKIQSLEQSLPDLESQLKALTKNYSAIVGSWSSEVETAIEKCAHELGQLDEEIKQAYEKQKLASIIASLQNDRNALLLEQSILEDKIASLTALQETKMTEVADLINATVMRLLKEDLPLQEEFINPVSANFDFAENSVYVNGIRNFSESSAVVLRHIFHLALLTACMEKPYMRIPRFIMLDGIDDGGMEKNRSHRLQEIIVEECKNYPAEFQLIYATSEINPSFEETDLVVGRAFTPELRSLNVV